MTFPDQLFFGRNITTWSDKLPAIYHGHFAFIDLDKYSEDRAKKIVYINVIRKPLDRSVTAPRFFFEFQVSERYIYEWTMF
jgi:heparan sulfate 2-O-sulfotransferase HS2ST1